MLSLLMFIDWLNIANFCEKNGKKLDRISECLETFGLLCLCVSLALPTEVKNCGWIKQHEGQICVTFVL